MYSFGRNQIIMEKRIIAKNLLLGFLSWLIPFVVSFLFYNRDGEILVPYATFKSIIMVVGTLSGSYLLYLYFKLINNDFIRNAVVVGLTWFVINIVLDSAVLIPMMKTTFIDYFMAIGVSYLAIPAISITMGFLLNIKLKRNEN